MVRGGRPAIINFRTNFALELALINHQALGPVLQSAPVIGSFPFCHISSRVGGYFMSCLHVSVHQGLVLQKAVSAGGHRTRNISLFRGQLQGVEMQLPIALSMPLKDVLGDPFPRVPHIVTVHALELASVLF